MCRWTSGPAVEVEQRRPEVAGEPRVAGEHHQRPHAALASPLPGDDPARHEKEADDGIRHDEADVAWLIRHPFGGDGQTDRAEEQRKPQEPHAS